jgi:urease subunit alpha
MPVAGIVKGDHRLKAGKIVAIGKAGNPHIMAGVDPRLIVGPNTRSHRRGLIATVGRLRRACAFRRHRPVRRMRSRAASPPCWAARSARPSPSIAAGLGPPSRCCARPKAFAMNFGFFARGSFAQAGSNRRPARRRSSAMKITRIRRHARSIDCLPEVADEYDFQVQLHADTINEAGFYESTLQGHRGRTIHMYHTEGAGGGHAPDIIRCNGEPNCSALIDQPDQSLHR